MNSPRNHFDLWDSIRRPIGTILLVGTIFAALLLAILLGQSLGSASFAQKAGVALRAELHADLVVCDPRLGPDWLLSPMAVHGMGLCHSHRVDQAYIRERLHL